MAYLLSGLSLGVAYAFPQLLGLPVLGMALLLMQFHREEHATRLNQIGKLYITFFVFHAFTNWWVSSWQAQTDPYLLISGIALAIGHPFFLMIPFLILWSIRKRLGTPWMLAIAPFAVAGFEWLHGQTDASYPWLSTGYAFIDSPAVQLASSIGVYGLTFYGTMLYTITAYIWIYKSKSYQWYGIVVTVVVLPMIYGWCLESPQAWKTTDGRSLTVGLVQPNENPWDKWSSGELQVEKNQRITDELLSVEKPDFVLWSETAIPYAIRQSANDPDMENLQKWVDSRTTLITGYADVVVYPDGQAPASARRSSLNPNLRFDSFNAAMLLSGYKEGNERVEIPVHRKSMLTPFAERMPFADQLSFAMNWFEWGVGISAWGKGTTRNPLPLLNNKDTIAQVGVIICIESIYPEVASDMVNNDADILAVITNDAWYNGTWGPRQHYNIARMRAIEQRRDIVRVGNSGVTGHINAMGRSVTEIPVQQTGFLVVQPNTNRIRSTFAVLGSTPIIFGLVLTLVLFVLARIPYFVRKLRDQLSTP